MTKYKVQADVTVFYEDTIIVDPEMSEDDVVNLVETLVEEKILREFPATALNIDSITVIKGL